VRSEHIKHKKNLKLCIISCHNNAWGHSRRRCAWAIIHRISSGLCIERLLGVVGHASLQGLRSEEYEYANFVMARSGSRRRSCHVEPLGVRCPCALGHPQAGTRPTQVAIGPLICPPIKSIGWRQARRPCSGHCLPHCDSPACSRVRTNWWNNLS
jgi:hypothetical protein